jgi:hypothetical protein
MTTRPIETLAGTWTAEACEDSDKTPPGDAGGLVTVFGAGKTLHTPDAAILGWMDGRFPK